MTPDLRIMLVAGEASGDAHGAKLAAAIRSAADGRNVECFGAVSHAMRAAGVEEVVDADNMAIVGLPEIARAVPMFLRALRTLVRAAEERRPDAVVLIDFPDFNLKLAKALKKRGFTVIYYISPQLWAWRQYRIRSVRKHVDLLITILPFEKQWFAERGVTNVEYVGSPLAREVHAQSSKDVFCEKHGFDPSRPIVALLPGSRHKEISRILPVMLEAAALMLERDHSVQFAVALARQRQVSEVEEAFAAAGSKAVNLRQTLKVISGETYDLLNAADAAAVTSGTATLETGLIGTPMAIVYKASWLNYKLLRPLIDVEHFGLINLIAGKRIVREMIQDDLTAEQLASELQALLDPERNAQVRRELNEAAEKLGHGGASARAADLIIDLIRRKAQR